MKHCPTYPHTYHKVFNLLVLTWPSGSVLAHYVPPASSCHPLISTNHKLQGSDDRLMRPLMRDGGARVANRSTNRWPSSGCATPAPVFCSCLLAYRCVSSTTTLAGSVATRDLDCYKNTSTITVSQPVTLLCVKAVYKRVPFRHSLRGPFFFHWCSRTPNSPVKSQKPTPGSRWLIVVITWIWRSHLSDGRILHVGESVRL